MQRPNQIVRQLGVAYIKPAVLRRVWPLRLRLWLEMVPWRLIGLCNCFYVGLYYMLLPGECPNWPHTEYPKQGWKLEAQLYIKTKSHETPSTLPSSCTPYTVAQYSLYIALHPNRASFRLKRDFRLRGCRHQGLVTC